TRREMCAGRARNLRWPRLRGGVRRGAGGGGPERIRQNLAVAADRGTACAGRRQDFARRRRPRTDARGTGALSGASRRPEAGPERVGKSEVLARLPWRRDIQPRRKSRGRRTRSRRAPARRLPFGRTAPTVVDRAASDGAAVAL